MPDDKFWKPHLLGRRDSSISREGRREGKNPAGASPGQVASNPSPPPHTQSNCGDNSESSTRFSTSILSWFEPIWDSDKRLEVFSNSVSISPRYCMWILKKLHGVHVRGLQHTVESGKQNISKKLCGVHPTVASTPQCVSYRGVRFRSVHHTAESGSTVCITPR